MNSTCEHKQVWFGTGKWHAERHPGRSNCIRLPGKQNPRSNNHEQIFLYITDRNPELDELSLQLA